MVAPRGRNRAAIGEVRRAAASIGPGSVKKNGRGGRLLPANRGVRGRTAAKVGWARKRAPPATRAAERVINIVI